jgi:hypothetical protein
MVNILRHAKSFLNTKLRIEKILSKKVNINAGKNWKY